MQPTILLAAAMLSIGLSLQAAHSMAPATFMSDWIMPQMERGLLGRPGIFDGQGETWCEIMADHRTFTAEWFGLSAPVQRPVFSGTVTLEAVAEFAGVAVQQIAGMTVDGLRKFELAINVVCADVISSARANHKRKRTTVSALGNPRRHEQSSTIYIVVLVC